MAPRSSSASRPADDGRHRPSPLNTLAAYRRHLELVCGLLIAIGLFTRPAAFLASGTMAVAYWYAHAPQNFFPVNNMGDAAILYCFVFLYLALRRARARGASMRCALGRCRNPRAARPNPRFPAQFPAI